jgi:hypothetical protein
MLQQRRQTTSVVIVSMADGHRVNGRWLYGQQLQVVQQYSPALAGVEKHATAFLLNKEGKAVLSPEQ